ncbi:hypothetical protein [Kitasatospora sp. NPDC056731]|uniref:hypothetical protein n=1 Tax=Kitasatospora sp. NPDC056731 TaxID=3155422 RepID=UPI0034190FDC
MAEAHGYDPTTRRLRITADSPTGPPHSRSGPRSPTTAPTRTCDAGCARTAAARQAAVDEAVAEREAILRQHYNRLREPEDAHRPAIGNTPTPDADQHARHQRERHRAALAVACATRAGAIPLRTTRPALARSGAA